MRKDLLALAVRIRVLEIELEKCPEEDRERRLGIWVELEKVCFVLKCHIFKINL